MIFHLLGFLVEIYLLLLIARALLSWFQVSGGGAMAKVNVFLEVITEPVLKPVRKILPPVRIGGSYLDLSILVVFLVAQIVVLPLLR